VIIRTKSYPRAALLGNPSDGYFGKTIAFLFRNFSAEVILYETPEIEILPADYDSNVFDSISELSDDVELYGYYGGIRLLKAAVKRFNDYCKTENIQLHEHNFTLRYSSNIPYRLGLAGSSAIITACFRALMEFYQVEIPLHFMANLVLSVETEELGIGAGLQDRVAQAYEVPIFMDFDQEIMESRNYGIYEPVERKYLQNLYIAYQNDLSEGSEVVHNDFRERYNFGVPEVVEAIKGWAEITIQGKKALESGDRDRLNQLINQNFDLRRSVMNISHKNIEMVELARSEGASAKFTGSGGAIIGTYEDVKMYENLKKALAKKNITIIKPEIL
jgi:glucuronokinase